MAKQGSRTLTVAMVCMVLVAWSEAGAAPVRLALKLEKGKTFYQRTVTDQQITQTLMGQQQVIDQSIGSGMKLEVLDVDSQGNMRIRHTFNWTLQKREAGVATIGETAAIRSNPDAPPMDAGGMKMKFDLSGTQEGTMRVDEATGLLLTSQGHQQLKGEIKVAMSADAPPMMAIPAIVEATFKVETSDKMWEPGPR